MYGMILQKMQDIH